MRRAAFGCRNALGTVFAGLIHTGIDARKSNDGTAVREMAYIANLSHELGGCCFTYTVHGMHGIVLRQLFCKSCHLSAQSGECHLASK